MLIELQYPFRDKWEKAYKVFDESTGRYKVLFYNSKISSARMGGMSFARYLMSVHLGYVVPDDLVVDHINDIKTDDRIENLQLLTPEQNRLKQEWYYIEYVQKNYGFECNWCGLLFLLTEREVNTKLRHGVVEVFCSRSCASKWRARGGKAIELMLSY